MTAMDYAAHEATYSTFLGMVKWSVIGLVILMALMGFFLT
ncbi:aa3-type cytochrome c oxidase subunit IV [Pseudoxanthobacter soli]